MRAGCGRGLFGGRGHGALVLLAERIYVGVRVGRVGRRVRAYGRLHPRADRNEHVRTLKQRLESLSHVYGVRVPRAGVIAQLVHVRVVLCQYGNGVALLPNDESGLLLGGVPEINAIKLRRDRERDSHVLSVTMSSAFLRMLSDVPPAADLRTPGGAAERCFLPLPWKQRCRHSLHPLWRCPEAPPLWG